MSFNSVTNKKSRIIWLRNYERTIYISTLQQLVEFILN